MRNGQKLKRPPSVADFSYLDKIMKKVIYILIVILFACNRSTTIPNNFKKIGTVKLVDLNNDDILINYDNHIRYNELKKGDEIYLFIKNNKITFIIESISTWMKCSLKNDTYDLNTITEGMDVYLDLENYIYQDLINLVINNFDTELSNHSETPYFKKMKKRILDNFHPPIISDEQNNFKVKLKKISKYDYKVVIILSNNGDVEDVRIINSNENLNVENSIIEAVQFCKNFGKIPGVPEGRLIGIPVSISFNPE